MKNYTLIMAVSSALLISACASSPKKQPVLVEAAPPIKLSKLDPDERQAEIKREKSIAERKMVVTDIPDWFLTPPKSDENVLYAVGTATSTDLAVVVEKSILDAKSQLADQVNGKISNNTRQIIKEGDGGHKPLSSYERATTNVTLQTAVKNYVVEQKSIHPTETGFRAYVLVKYPIEDSNSLGTSIDNFKAMKELEQQVKDNDKRVLEDDAKSYPLPK